MLAVDDEEQVAAGEQIAGLRFDVIGTPAPKGSSRAIKRGDRAIHVAGTSDKNQRAIQSWAANVSTAARRALAGARPFVKAPLAVSIEFRLMRPTGHFKRVRGKLTPDLKPTAPRKPQVKPDLDKLIRATLDPLEGVVFDGDSRVVEIYARKVYTAVGFPDGATIEVINAGGG